MKQPRKSTQIALGGVFSALCLMIMFLTGLVPFGTYAFPAIAGAMLVAVLEENGAKVAMMVYVSVSLLSLIMVPDREATMMFIFLFGYYPVVKQKIEKLKLKMPQWFAKIALYLVAVASAYYLMIHFLGMPDLIDEFGEFGKYGALVFLLAGAVIFVLYDVVLSKYTIIYKYYFREKLQRS